MPPVLYKGVLEFSKTAGKGRFWHIHISPKVLINPQNPEILLRKIVWIASNASLDYVFPSALRLLFGVLEGKRQGTSPQYPRVFWLSHLSGLETTQETQHHSKFLKQKSA